MELKPRAELPLLRIPRLTMSAVKTTFSLKDIDDLEHFEKLGRKLAREPEDELRRTQLGARVGRCTFPVGATISYERFGRIFGALKGIDLQDPRGSSSWFE